MSEKLKVIIAKPGLDGHDHGAKVVVRALMDAGFDVIYTGLRQTPEQIVELARKEDADVIGLSSMAGAHLPFCRRLAALLKQQGRSNKLWIIGGNIPQEDHAALMKLGFHGIFPTGSKLQDIVAFIKERVP